MIEIARRPRRPWERCTRRPPPLCGGAGAAAALGTRCRNRCYATFRDPIAPTATPRHVRARSPTVTHEYAKSRRAQASVVAVPVKSPPQRGRRNSSGRQYPTRTKPYEMLGGPRAYGAHAPRPDV
ncbi:hypothetical protein EVAR_92764_1 [Eumeta japonica]|uniref:Uncharacterized protein n=1 Tax=Eumeta variegata TaxID=151549 RepID=A0A4C1T009_EUMVA|nr:hypothetical protein EVAR_92764_1 [Eumeta japonica]